MFGLVWNQLILNCQYLTNPGKREISRDSFQYSLDGYNCLEDLRYLTKYFSC